MSRTANNITIVCYDIANNRLRSKIDKCMKDFGTRIQYSIFLCRLDADGIKRCRGKLNDILEKFATEKEPVDSVIIFERLNFDHVDCLLGNKISRDAPNFLIL